MMTKTLEDYTEAVGELLEEEHKYPRGVERVLDVLRDGGWHTNRQIIRISGQIHITARIYEARNPPYNLNIEYKRDGIYHCYRWVK